MKSNKLLLVFALVFSLLASVKNTSAVDYEVGEELSSEFYIDAKNANVYGVYKDGENTVIVGDTVGSEAEVAGFIDSGRTPVDRVADAFISVFDKDDNLVFGYRFGGSGADVFKSVVKVADGYIVVGKTYSNDADLSGSGTKAGWTNPMVVKFTNEGTVGFVKAYNTDTYESSEFNSIVELDDGFAILATMTDGSMNKRAVKMDDEGNIDFDTSTGKMKKGNDLIIKTTNGFGMIVLEVDDQCRYRDFSDAFRIKEQFDVSDLYYDSVFAAVETGEGTVAILYGDMQDRITVKEFSIIDGTVLNEYFLDIFYPDTAYYNFAFDLIKVKDGLVVTYNDKVSGVITPVVTMLDSDFEEVFTTNISKKNSADYSWLAQSYVVGDNLIIYHFYEDENLSLNKSVIYLGPQSDGLNDPLLPDTGEKTLSTYSLLTATILMAIVYNEIRKKAQKN